LKKRLSERPWFPFWADKWIFGSMRLECTIEERAIWIDLLALASKDDGHIRANEETPYLPRQLAGIFNIPEEILKSAIEKFIKLNKLARSNTGTLYVVTWDKYQLSESYERVKKHRKKKSNGKTLQCNEKGVTKSNKNNKNNKKKIKITYDQAELDRLFEKWWKRYPRSNDKGKAKGKWLNLIQNEGVDPQELEDALTGYINILNNEQTDEQFIKHAKTFLYNGNKKKKIESTWRPFIKYADPKYKAKPPL